MDYTELFTESINMLTLNKMRTALAALGIIIGVGAVIALMSLGQASQKAVQAQIQSLGSNLLTVTPGAQQSGNIRGAAGSSETLTFDDAKAILTSDQITTVKNVAPQLNNRAQVTNGKNNTNTQIIGVTSSYADVRQVTISSGNFITNRDVDAMTKVAVLGPQVVTDLFGEGSNPVGQTIRINGQSLRIIGVTVAKGGTGFQNQDDIIYVPLTTAQKQLFGSNSLSSIAVQANSEDVMAQAQDQVGYLLLARHKLTDPSKADFMIISQNDILGAASQVTGTFTSLLAGIAGISLLVGGIGIMNIMLVTVTERTREIGLRKALGAKRNIIISQFLIESFMLTICGGLVGLLAGIVTSYGLSQFLGTAFVIDPTSVVLAISVSACIGIVFGWYPAQKAAKLQPIEALRYE